MGMNLVLVCGSKSTRRTHSYYRISIELQSHEIRTSLGTWAKSRNPLRTSAVRDRLRCPAAIQLPEYAEGGRREFTSSRVCRAGGLLIVRTHYP